MSRNARGRKNNGGRNSRNSRNSRLLDRINGPADVQSLSLRELGKLAEEIRERIIEVVSDTGGHLAPSLGVVELTLALHYVFDSPWDRIIWDVGHQAYAHKLVTGRRNQFHTLRRAGGLSGFPSRAESPHDHFGTGHASTAISAALGMAAARDQRGEHRHVVAVVGDGALTGGLAFEGLNQVGHLGSNILIVLNDNRMSISRNVGAMSKYLTRITMTPIYNRFEEDVWELLGKIPKAGGKARGLASRIKESLRNLVVPTILFEELGTRYYGPVKGHDLPELISTLEQIKELKGPRLLHVVTRKGRGYRYAEEDSARFHGVGSFDKETGRAEKKSQAPSYTEVFGATLVELAEADRRVVAVTAAMPDGTGLAPFRDRFPDRFYDVGIAEQHAVTFAAGLAAGGMRPVVAIYSTFMQRAFDQIIHDVALQKLPVRIVLDRAGMVGEDGATHHGAFDLSYLRLIPNLTLMSPRDEGELRHMLKTLLAHEDGPVALRYPRSPGVGIKLADRIHVLPRGKAELLRPGRDVALLAVGSMVHPCLEAAELLAKEGVDAAVLNARFIKPLDETAIIDLARSTGRLLTVEENVAAGGFGSAVMELLAEWGLTHVHVRVLGVHDSFMPHASRRELLEQLGLTTEGIVHQVRDLMAEPLLHDETAHQGLGS